MSYAIVVAERLPIAAVLRLEIVPHNLHAAGSSSELAELLSRTQVIRPYCHRPRLSVPLCRRPRPMESGGGWRADVPSAGGPHGK